MVTYNSFFNKFPKVEYDFEHTLVSGHTVTMTNIFFRIGFIQKALENTTSYYTLSIEDGDTPEILADKIYNDSGAGWMIILVNKIADPQFDWPMSYDAFDKYLTDKYGSIEAAKTSIHHHEMVMTRVLQPDGTTTEFRYIVDKEKLTDNNLNVPHNYYEIHGSDPGSLANVQEVNTYTIDGKTVVETIHGEAISNYDYEVKQNDGRRVIKVIKKEYYAQIQNEYDKLTNFKSSYIRRVR